ncbi:hypothetical protein DFH08DRAFT_718317 [Mycena albidolilacea]|uniref:Sodefrin-like factor n=1 Tax=Mycena albidolilacea TaxID=1033008 RepID=A0AAD7EBY2_9AGAR|nr:hypothetical protein DFH08DRAFT_718317 [Mycena albidolilacea]
MKLTATFAILVAFFTTLSSAGVLEACKTCKSCNRGGIYCSVSLLNRGNYREHIKQVLSQEHQPQDEAHIDYSLFNCLSGGEIMFIKYCSRGCGGTTTIDSDYCL